MNTRKHILALHAHLEEHASLASFLIGGGVFWRWGADIFDSLNSNIYNYVAVYSSIFDVAGILTAFLFAFYTYAIGSDSRFMNQARKSIAFKKMLQFVKRAIFVGAILTFATIPMMIFEPLPTTPYSLIWFICLLWVALSFAAAGSFWRAVTIFWVFASNDDGNGKN